MKRHLLHRETPDRPRVDSVVSNRRCVGWIFHRSADYLFVAFIEGLEDISETSMVRLNARLRRALDEIGGVR